MIEAISGAAAAVAESCVAVEQAAAVLATAEDRRNGIKARIDEKNSERASIVAARKNGLENAKDGGRLMTLTADLDGLAELLAEATTLVNSAAAHAAEAGRTLAQAEGELAKARDTELLRRLIENAVVLDGLLVKNIKEIADTWKRLGRSPGRESWVPTPALAEAIKKLDLTRENRR